MVAEELNRIEVPKWLHEEFVESALRSGLKEPQLKLISMNIKPATAAGDNYVSRMFRATCLIQKTPGAEEQSLPLILKVTHSHPPAEQIVINRTWEKEAVVMRDVLPKLTAIIKKEYPEKEPFSADMIYHGTEPASVLILEDLKEYGYANANRMDGLNKEMTLIALDSLAKFHVSSLALFNADPSMLEVKQLQYTFWGEKFDAMIRPLVLTSYQGFLDEVATWEDIPKETFDRLAAAKHIFLEKLYEATRKQPHDKLNVLLHGDCWISNFMYSTKANKDISFRFVDFQCTYINHPSLDLNYFLFSSPNAQIRISCIEEFLAYYHRKFMENVERLNVELKEPFTFEELLADFQKNIFLGLMALIVIFPLTVCDSDTAPEFTDFFNETSKQFMYKNKKFKEVFKNCLPYLIKCGVF